MSESSLSLVSGTSFEEAEPVFPLSEIRRFIKDCISKTGAPASHAEALATCLTEADYRGHYGDGLNQLETYIDEILQGGCDKEAVPHIVKETSVTAWVDGNNGLGVVVGNFCMDLAIRKAKTSGVGLVVAKGSNSFGNSGLYPLQALREGLLGMCFTNSFPMVAPAHAREGAYGTNPISVAAPASNGDSFILDIATAAVGVGKIEILSRNKMPVPKEWADPQTGALRPLGGADPISSYKGFGLGLFVEIICGILSDSAYGPNIRKYGDFNQPSNLGHCFVVINLSYFAPGFEDRLSDLLNFIRNMTPIDPNKPVIVPGDHEREHMELVDKQGGIHYSKHLIKRCKKIANKFEITPLTPL